MQRTGIALTKRHQHKGSGYITQNSEWPARTWHLWRYNNYSASKRRLGRGPFAQRMPHEYDDPDKLRPSDRATLEWRNKWVGVDGWENWPFVDWRDDPVRSHKSEIQPSRTISALTPNPVVGKPLWNHYQESSRDYRVQSHAPLVLLVPFLNTICGKVWSPTEMGQYLQLLDEEGWNTIQDVHASIANVREWNETFAKVPPNFVEHVALLVEDIVTQNQKKEFRRRRHHEGVLRDTLMRQYYALPYYLGPAMPTTLAQPSGIEPTEASTFSQMHRAEMADAFFPMDLKFGRSHPA